MKQILSSPLTPLWHILAFLADPPGRTSKEGQQNCGFLSFSMSKINYEFRYNKCYDYLYVSEF